VDLIRFEVHGPAAELETLKEPLAKLKPKWFVHQCSLAREESYERRER